MVQTSGEDFDPKALPANIDTLAIYRIVKKDLPRLASLRSLPVKSLDLRWVFLPDLTQFPLPETLENLEVWQSPKLKSLDGIQAATRLRRLKYWDNGKLENAHALANLPNLRELVLEGGMNARLKLSDLEFLRPLRLDRLDLNGIAPADVDVSPVLQMQGLRELSVFGPDLEIGNLARLAARFPTIQDDLNNLADYPRELGMSCKRCAGTLKMLRLRRKKFLWCPECEAKTLQKTLSTFNALVEAARQDPR